MAEAMHHLITASDRELFKRCRRAWDLGATTRGNLEPRVPPVVADLDRALHDALAVYYYPGMWQWPRALVRPLANQAYAEQTALSPDQEREWADQLAAGERLLGRYLDWAAEADRFEPVRVATSYAELVPDPRDDREGLVTAEGRGVRYRARIDALVVDEHSATWVLDHRLVSGRWTDFDQLLLDERSLAHGWAWQTFYVGVKIAGTIFNELSADGSTPDPAPPVPAEQHRFVKRTGSGPFQRTAIRRTAKAYETAAHQLGREALEMLDPQLPLYPTPSEANCGRCDYRAPCLAMTSRRDPGPILAADYQPRPGLDMTGRLGVDSGFHAAEATRDLRLRPRRASWD
jgi:hypothetical protein